MLNTSGLAPSNRQAPLPAPYARAEGTPEIVARVLRKVWYDFSQWKKDMARSSLRSLQPPTQSPWDGLPLLPSIPVPKTNAPLQCKQVEASAFTVLEFTDDGDLAQDPWTLQSGSTLYAPKSFDSVPVYENFTPADRSIYVGNDNNDVPYVRLRNSNDISYVRYIDDPKYDAVRELDDWHGTLAWMDLKDHDFGLLVMETARRLFIEYGIPYEQQQAPDILPLPLFTATDMITGVIRPGLLDEYTKRLHYEYDPALRITPYAPNLPSRGCGPACFQKSALAEVHRLAKFITKSFPAPRIPLPSKPLPTNEFRDTSELMLFTP
ncbi:hypothetical protein K525DRAFT_291542 [Schizophyllum commune Loenen D]|nr:hypothetical protein K525DRAFT_291542 [Schizophyllum commune Loenen D]